MGDKSRTDRKEERMSFENEGREESNKWGRKEGEERRR